MKLKLSLLLFFVSVVILSSFPSCTKETVTTVTQIDTVTIKDTVTVTPLTNTQLLVQNSPWEIEQTVYDIGGTISEYIRGGVNTTGLDYDVFRYSFNANGTGTDIDNNGNTHSLTWQFTTADESNIQFVINQTPVYTTTWSLVSISDTAILQTNSSDAGVLETAKLIPVP